VDRCPQRPAPGHGGGGHGDGRTRLALGLGQARAISNGFGAAPWVAAGVLADATDLIATVRARRDLPGLGVVAITAVAGGSAALGLWLARAVD
jgi:hypothetical protein